jgi:FkbM family methyltransferase
VGVGERVEAVIVKWRTWRTLRTSGPLGDFYRAGGQDLLYRALPVTTGDLVIDGGGYHGSWTDEMLCRYGCRSIIFEPVAPFSAALRARYARNSNVEVLETALSNKTGRAKISFSMDGSSIFRPSSKGESFEISLLDFSAFLRERDISDVACLKLNIEGGEYDVLEQLIEVDLLRSIRSLLVQFHQVDSHSEMRRSRIQTALKRSHQCRFDYSFVWECWVRSG